MATNADSSVQLRAANRVFPAAANNEDDDDTISLTSTVPDEVPSDTEYVVEGVRAENLDGSRVLVEWSNFPLDECTWEPIDNLPQELRDAWEQTKQEEDHSVAAAFQQKYEAARKEKEYEALQRHRRRNAKRKRRGLPTTPFHFGGLHLPDSEDELESAEETLAGDIPDIEADGSNHSSANDDSDFDEAEEGDAIDHTADAALEPSEPRPPNKPRKTTRPPNRIFTFDPDTSIPSNKTIASTQRALLKTSKNLALRGRMSTNKHASRDVGKPAKSGYQGSARKSSGSNMLPNRSGNVAAAKAATTVKTAVTAPLATGPEVVKKSFTAKKTGQQAAINIFKEGKVRKQRQSIGDIEVDSGRQGKLYNKHQYRRKAELRSRDKEDLAPDIERLATSLFTPGSAAAANNAQGAPQRRSTGDVPDDNDAPFTMREEAAMRSITVTSPTRAGRTDSITSQLPRSALASPPIAPSTFQNPKRGSLSLEKDRPRKKSKSVRFTEADDESTAVLPEKEKEGELVKVTDDDTTLVSEPMEIDIIHDSIHDTILHSPSVLPREPKAIPLATHKSTNLQSVGKQIRLSTVPSQSLDVNFDDIPRDADQGWLTAFLDDDHMVFGHTVLAETLTSQLKSPGSQGFQWLCSGKITSISHGSSLETIAEHLRVSSSGLFKTNAQYHLLIFPTKCDEFQELAGFGVDPTNPDGVALKYFIFKSEQPISRLIRPSSDTSEGMQVEVGKEKMLLFPKLLNMQFSSFVEGPLRSKQKHFFLAFPLGSIEWFKAICSWLFVRDPSCKIYSNFEPGGWSAFMAKARTDCGIVILHETMIPFVRRFPSIVRLLHSNSNFNFWCFSEVFDLEPVQPEKRGFIPAMPKMFTRLFPFGKAILITPSFMVSEPQKTLTFLKWFFTVQAKHSFNNKLVVAYSITDFLRDLSGEKCTQMLLLKNTSWKNLNPMDVAIQKNDAALTDDDLEARQKAWLYFDQWLTAQPESEIPFSEVNNVIFADRSIDPHDEQSLVNWFGWWSLAHSDEFRRFYVLGSSSSTKSMVARMSQNIQIPEFDRGVINDPDEAIRVTLRLSGKVVEAGDEPRGTEALHDDKGWFQSQFFQNKDSNIRPFLIQLDHRGGHQKLYNTPVSWADKAMADHFGDHHMEFSTIEQWWKFSLPWLRDKHKCFNTYLGFFYTIKDDWSHDNFPPGLKPRRHPWFVVYRPVDPHDSKAGYRHGRTELIIWDVRAGEELEESSTVDLSQLTWMQQELIRYVQLHAHEKNPGSTLERVWIGGFQVHRSTCQSTLAADITAEYFKNMTEHLKSVVPGAARYLSIHGFREVPLFPTAAAAPARTFHAGNVQQSGAQDKEDDDLDSRIIFHPPRGSEQLKPRGSSKCTNDFFEAARLARLRDKNAKEMAYTFRPTMEWYQEQIEEGRQYEHIMVDDWQKIFEQLRITQPRRSKDDRQPSFSTSEHTSSAPWATARDSVSSNHSSPSSLTSL